MGATNLPAARPLLQRAARPVPHRLSRLRCRSDLRRRSGAAGLSLRFGARARPGQVRPEPRRTGAAGASRGKAARPASETNAREMREAAELAKCGRSPDAPEPPGLLVARPCRARGLGCGVPEMRNPRRRRSAVAVCAVKQMRGPQARYFAVCAVSNLAKTVPCRARGLGCAGGSASAVPGPIL